MTSPAPRLLLLRRVIAALLTSCLFFAVLQQVEAGTIVIDDFSAPDDPAMLSLSGGQVGGLLFKQTEPSVLGGERDVLLELLGGSSASTATMLIGGGYLDLSTGSFGSTLSLQYDGFGPGDDDTSQALFNNMGLDVDLTDGGENQFFQLDFASLDAGPGMDAIEMVIEVTSASGTAIFMGLLEEAVSPTSYLFDFDDFQTTGMFNWQNVTGMNFVLNADGQEAVDLMLDGISVVVAEPSAALLAFPGCAATALIGLRRFRRRRVLS